MLAVQNFVFQPVYNSEGLFGSTDTKLEAKISTVNLTGLLINLLIISHGISSY